MPNRLSRFWQELKRRKVIRMITVYAAAAFVILELVSMSEEPFGLPEWTFVLAVILLSIGFLIAIILSWIYDIHPEGGMVRTEPAEKVKDEDAPKSSRSWKIASYISFVVIVGLIVLNIIPRSGKRQILDKSIAVLPFRNDSPDEEKMYFINGTMEAILDNLCKIEDLRVPGRTSVEQYRGKAKPIPVIAQELKVSYILEGSGQKIGNRVLLTVQLLDGINDHHLWSKQYDREIQEVEDLIDIQSEIAQLVAAEIKAVITPPEKELIEKLPTADLSAYDLYLKANNYRQDYSDTRNIDSYQKAVSLYTASIEIDPEFAKAYTGLAFTLWNLYFRETYIGENYMDSCLNLANIALSFDNQLSEAYYLRSQYYYENGQIEESLSNLDSAIKYNPNYYEAYSQKGWILRAIKNDFIKGLENHHKALGLIYGKDRPSLLRGLASTYTRLGLYEKARQYNNEAFVLDGDTLAQYLQLRQHAFHSGNTEEALRLARQVIEIDSTNFYPFIFFIIPPGHEEEVFRYANRYLEYLRRTGEVDLWSIHRIGYAFWRVGRYEEARYYFDEHIRYSLESINSSRSHSSMLSAQYDLAGVYAFLGEKENAYQLLEEIEDNPYFNWLHFLKQDPLFDSLREEERFQRILQNIEAKNQAEHERVRQWLEENEML